MKKILFLMLLSVTFTLPALAIRPLQKVWTVKQSDSTSIKILVHGEGGRTVFFTSLDGKIIVKGADNNFYHAIIRDGELQLTSHTKRATVQQKKRHSWPKPEPRRTCTC